MKKDKLKSRTLWLSILCLFMAALWGTMSMIKEYEPAWLNGAMPALIGVVMAYIVGNKVVETKESKCAPIDKG
jgi:hypothetical protein